MGDPCDGGGGVTGLSSTLFLPTLDFAQGIKNVGPYFYIGLPLILPLVAWLGHGVKPEAHAHSTDKVIEIIHSGKSIPILSVLNAFVLPVLTVGAADRRAKKLHALMLAEESDLSSATFFVSIQWIDGSSWCVG